jgi:hypothetical protein
LTQRFAVAESSWFGNLTGLEMTLMCLERVRPEPGERKPAR